MILDARTDSFITPYILILDAETAEPVERHSDLIYVDTDRGVFRLAHRGADGEIERDEDGELNWNEYQHALRIIPNPDLEPLQYKSVEEWLEARQREGYPTFELGPPTTFADAMHEAEVEAACDELELSDGDRSFVLASHRFSPKLLHTILEHNGDHRCYVESKLILRAKMNGRPEPVFPPRASA